MPEQRIEQRRKQCSGHRNQSGMSPKRQLAFENAAIHDHARMNQNRWTA